MAESYYLIDSNAVIDYLGNRLPKSGMTFMNDVVDAVANLSVITKMEVLGFNTPEDDYNLLSDFMEDAVVLYLTEEIVQECINIRKQQSIKLPDAIIAATAVVYDMDLITRNLSDFKNIHALDVVNPHLL
jgi:predicted nucleic acid-binding protein